MNLSSVYSLYDRIISVTFYRIDRETIKRNNEKLQKAGGLLSSSAASIIGGMEDAGRQITIPYLSENGMKPNIQVSLTMLPSSVCFNMTVTLTNAALVKNIDINTFQAMSVTLGYTNNAPYESGYNVESFTGPVFTSYIEKPAPNSTIIFEGVACGKSGVDLFAHNPFEVIFYESEYTIKEVCEKIARAIGVPANFENCLESLYNRKLQFSDNRASAENKFALLNWLQSVLHNHFEYLNKGAAIPNTGSIVKGQYPFIYVFLSNDVLYVISNVSETDRTAKRRAITLNQVKSASFQAAVLNVVALYNPRLHPGDVFYMPPVYFKDNARVGNMLDTSIYNPDDGLYRALKIDVHFGTYGSTNEMTVMALPVSTYAGETTPEEVLQETEKWAQTQREKVEQSATKSLSGATSSSVYGPQEQEGVIKFGTPKPVPVEDIPPKDMWSTSWSGWTSAARVKPDPGMTLSTLADAQWGRELFYLDDSQLEEPFNRNQPEGVPLYYFFPLIQVATYKNMKQPGGDKVYKIDINNPDKVWTDYSVAVPPLTLDIAKSYIGNTQVANIFKLAVDYYNNLGYSSWAKIESDIYNYLTKGRRV